MRVPLTNEFQIIAPPAVTNRVVIHRDFTLGGSNPMELAGPVVWVTNTLQRSINVTNPADLVISGPVSRYGFNKNGAGLLTFNGICSHNGPSTISSGPLALGPGGIFTGATTLLVGQFRVLSQTNVAEPVANWEVISTNTFDASGSLIVTNVVNPAERVRFFRIVQP